ncbi:MAG: hypothetical protein C4523_10060 [Myxococcales bacterium]|nr:MAG: hypothetical protein C4523_10060 [Myxococcales bacterium]
MARPPDCQYTTVKLQKGSRTENLENRSPPAGYDFLTIDSNGDGTLAKLHPSKYAKRGAPLLP